MPPANNNVAAFVAGWHCAYPAYNILRPDNATPHQAFSVGLSRLAANRIR